LIVQQNYSSNLYPAKILDLSAKPFFLLYEFNIKIVDRLLSRVQIYKLNLSISEK